MPLRDGISVAHLLLQVLDYLRAKVYWYSVYPLGIKDQVISERLMDTFSAGSQTFGRVFQTILKPASMPNGTNEIEMLISDLSLAKPGFLVQSTAVLCLQEERSHLSPRLRQRHRRVLDATLEYLFTAGPRDTHF